MHTHRHACSHAHAHALTRTRPMGPATLVTPRDRIAKLQKAPRHTRAKHRNPPSTDTPKAHWSPQEAAKTISNVHPYCTGSKNSLAELRQTAKYHILLYISIPTKQKINEVEIPHFMQFQLTFPNMRIFLPWFLDVQLWRQTGHIRASGALFLCIQVVFIRITSGSQWASRWIILLCDISSYHR